MDQEAVFLLVLAGAAALFALADGIGLLLKRKRTAWTTGVITAAYTPTAKAANGRNSKWAEVVYTVDRRSYTSRHRVQVPLSARVGDAVRVRYDTRKPEKIYPFSAKRVLIFTAIAAVCLLAAGLSSI